MIDAMPAKTKFPASRYWSIGAAGAIVIGLTLQIAGAWTDGPTLDEHVHLSAGIADWQFRQLEYNDEHPPLSKLLAGGLVLLFTPVRLDPSLNPERSLDRAIYRPHDIFQAQRVIALARMPTILFWLICIVVLWRWAAELFGELIGGTVAALAIFDPTLLGHGHLITNDVPVTAAIVLSLWTLWRYVRRPTRWRLVGFASAVGLAAVIKFSGVVLIIIVPAMLIYLFTRRQLSVRRVFLASSSAVLGFFAFTWLIYTLPFLVAQPTINWNPAFQPFRYYLDGVLKLIQHNQTGHTNYFFGQSLRSSTVWYFPVALLTKLPIPVLVGLVGLLFLPWSARQQSSINLIWFSIPLVAILGFALTSNLNIGLRHILPAFPFLYLLIGAGLHQLQPVKPIATRWAAGLLALSVAGISLAAWPHTIAYFNGLVGGTSHGERILNGADLDWGQDSWRLAAWLRTHQVKNYSLNIASPIPTFVFTGATTMTPDIALPKDQHPKGPTIISKKVLARQNEEMTHYRSLQPVDQIGSTILVYEQ